jgi:hypothetical protein
MILITPGFAFLLLLLIFRPVRRIVSWLLLGLMCVSIYACATMN